MLRSLLNPVFESLTVDGELDADSASVATSLDIPHYDDKANAPAQDGRIIYITGDGATTPEGFYQRQSGGYVQVGGGSGAPADAQYVTLSTDADLSNESLHANLSGSDLHTPATHASRHSDGGADEVTVENLAAASTDTSLAFKPDGSGGVQAESVGSNVPAWTEDANSPIDVTNQTSVQYTVDGAYDQIMVIARPDNTGYFGVQVNGDSGSNYDFHRNDGTTTTGETNWEIARARERKAFGLVASGLNQVKFWHEAAQVDANAPMAGENSNVSIPIDTFTLLDGGGNSRSTFARVYGLTL